MGSILFWGVTAALATATGGLLVAALSRGQSGQDKAAYDLQVYRDQLKEVERDLARGVIAADEAARLRTEIGRKVLGADAALAAGAAQRVPGPPARLTAAVILVILGGSAFGLYALRGHPGAPDQPMALRLEQSAQLRAERPSQAEAEAAQPAALPALPVPDDAGGPRHAELMEQLRRVMAERPNDLQGQELLARNEALLGNHAAAARAQAMVVTLKGPVATADDLARQADLMVLAAGGRVTPEAESVLAAALEKDPANGMARYYSGLLFLQVERPDMTFRFWSPLWQESRPDDPWVPYLRDQLPDIAWLAGQHRYEMPALRAALPGPDAAAIEAAGDLSPEERQDMVRGMVDGLMQRLATEGGTAPEWARLIRALGVLGDKDRGTAILGEARGRFAEHEADLAEINAAAAGAGFE